MREYSPFMYLIPIKPGINSIVEKEDYERLSNSYWELSGSKTHKYAYRRIGTHICH